ncbi:MAG: SDR family oxidoreductase [Candidatus Marinimicrobia bacterium]|nr:SDR family oxidoreductase [Candidatus Neomarinimicrobiota bacterium]
MTYNDMRIVLTGASSGIGAALARQLAAEGARLVLAARNEDNLAAVAKTCHELGGETLVVPTDVTDQAQCQALIGRAVAAWGGLDALFLNAGVSMWSRFEDVTDITFFERIMAVNYFGVVYCTHYALPHLQATRGRLVVVTSSAAKTGAPLHSGYAASKHAVHGFFDALRAELLGSGVSITLAVPMFVRTDIRLHGFQGDGSHPKTDPYDDSKSMSADEAARITIKAARKRKREVLMTLELQAAVKLRPFVPGLIDRIARRKVGLD